MPVVGPGASWRVVFDGGIDPYGGRQGFWAWWSADESLRMRGVGHEAGAVTQVEDRRRAAVMHGGRREIAEAAVVVVSALAPVAYRSTQRTV